MVKTAELNEFLKISGSIFDVRSPGEYAQGHIPGAYSLPLFTDEEHALIGTSYKLKGRKAAVLQGMHIVAPKFPFFIETIENVLREQATDIAKIHCWRGGMRSSSLAVFLEMAGFECITLCAGYKAFRRWTLDILKGPFRLHVVGGMTGCGKTDILHQLARLGAQILDLEALANHRGSSFGMLGMTAQPTNEQFENDIAYIASKINFSQPLWVENESRLIGSCKIPDALYLTMKSSPLFIVERPLKERLNQIQEGYWRQDTQMLIEGVNRLCKKFGGVKTREIIAAIENKNFRSATVSILEYYDQSYEYEMQKHRHQRPHHCFYGENYSAEEWARTLLSHESSALCNH